MNYITINKYQERYNRIADKCLKEEYGYFISMLSHKGIGIGREMTPENNGLQNFLKRAESCQYKLGLKPVLNDGESILHSVNFSFKSLPIHRRNMVGVKQLKYKSGWITLNNPDIEGFGVSLNLLGWSKFIGLNTELIQNRLAAGETIESIAESKIKDTTLILFDGKCLCVSDACKRAGLSRTSFYNTLKRTDEDPQALFDRMRSTERKQKSVNKDEYKYSNGKYWIEVTESDYKDIALAAISTNMSIKDTISRLIKIAKEAKRDERT